MTKRKKTVKERNWVVPIMTQNTRCRAFADRKKENSRKACRNFKYQG